MSGMFSSPAPPPPPPMPEVKDPAEAERENRLEALERRRRGRSGTVETGFRGVLNSGPATDGNATGKTRLGE